MVVRDKPLTLRVPVRRRRTRSRLHRQSHARECAHGAGVCNPITTSCTMIRVGEYFPSVRLKPWRAAFHKRDAPAIWLQRAQSSLHSRAHTERPIVEGAMFSRILVVVDGSISQPVLGWVRRLLAP